ncbi:MAG: hypothetical protein VX519_05585 [Myxococcota bacterium]|nr:hypothetical protein [Myxococcota bacterium]
MTETFAASLRIVIITIWALGVGFFAHDSPQPFGDALTRAVALVQPPASDAHTEGVLRVTLAPRAPIRAWQRTAALAREKGAIGVGVIGPALPQSQSFVTLNPKVPLLEELGLPRDRDGKHRRFYARNSNGPTFLTRLLSESGRMSPEPVQRIPLAQQKASSITAAQLSALPGSALEGRIVLVSGEAPWGTAALPTAVGVIPIAEVLYRVVSGNPVSSFSPGTILLAFGIGGILFARLLEPPRRRIFRWVVGLSAASSVAFCASLWFGHAFPLDALLFLVISIGCFSFTTRSLEASPALGTAPLQSRTNQSFHHTCCLAALHQSGALASWVAILDGDWKENARAGDAGPLPTESLLRILNPDVQPAPEDSAFLVFPFSHSKPGALVIQPGDQLGLELEAIGSAVAHLLETSPVSEPLESASALIEKAWLEHNIGALYDVLGRPLIAHPAFKAWLIGKDIDPALNLMELSKALEWAEHSLSHAWSRGEITLQSDTEQQFHLRRLLPPGGHNGMGLEMAEVVPSSDGQAG